MSPDPEPGPKQRTSKVAKKPVPLWAALALALVLIVLPALAVGPVFGPFVVLWAVCALALSFKSEFAQIRKQRLRNLGIYLFAAVVSVIGWAYRIDTAQARGDKLVSAIKAFRAENSSYPANVEALVPTYIDTVPIGPFGRFYYFLDKEQAKPFLFFMTMPPFGRRGYCFEGNCMGDFANPPTKDKWYDFD
jgi:hypothetical protein